MNFIRQHWFDAGFILSFPVAAFILLHQLEPLDKLLWLSLISLFLHQFEEYRYPGYFPGMLNSVLFKSAQPDRYPLNTHSALVVNVAVGWLFYFLAAWFGAAAIWLGIATLLVSTGNIFAHTLLFNLKGKTLYNPGMFTSIALFLPIVACFLQMVISNGQASSLDWITGIALGAILNYAGILKIIDLLKRENSRYVFPARSLPPRQRQG